MGRFKVFFSEKTEKDLEPLPDEEFNRIINGCKRLEENPLPDGKHIKKLRGYERLYRK